MVQSVWLSAISAVLLVAVVSSQAPVSPPTPSPDLTHSNNLDGDDIYWLYWKYDADTITFEVHVRTTGYIGLGFGDNGRMGGADVVIGWVKDGQTYFKDRHAVGNSMPIEDRHQDYVLVSGEEKDGFTVLRFYRKLDTCDDEDFLINKDTVRVIFAWSGADPDSDADIHYHGPTRRGVKSILFLSPTTPEFNPEGLLEFDLLQNKVEIPAIDTYYHCTLFKAPAVNKKHHIVHISPVIQEGNVAHVHHNMLIQCHGEFPANYTGGSKCGVYPEACTFTMLAWGIGQGGLSMPDAAGISVGGPDDPTYYLLETHYDNPQELSTLVDSSGVRLYYTADLREHDVGFLILGQALMYPPIGIPPGMEDFAMHTYCDAACTDRIPEAGVKVFASLPHSHTAGVGVYTQQIRDGVHIGHIGQDVHYDFNYQAIRTFTKEKILLPGDLLQTTCVYDTTRRNNMTWGGLGTRNEMCINFLYYYPAMELAVCNSMIQTKEQWFNLVDTRARKEGWNERPKLEDILEWLPFIPWRPKDLEDVRNFENAKEYTQYCISSGEDSDEIVQPERPRPDIRGPYREYNPMCGPAPTPPGGGFSGAQGLSVTMVTLLTCLIGMFYTDFMSL